MALLMASIVTWSVVSTQQEVDAQVVQADYDYEASGYLVPAGGAAPTINGGVVGGVRQAGYYPGESVSGSSSCDSGTCDSPGGFGRIGHGLHGGGGFGGGGIGHALHGGGGFGGGLHGGGVLGGGLHGGGGLGGGLLSGACGCQACLNGSRLSDLRHRCPFCRGAGCSFCQLKQNGGLLGLCGGGAGELFQKLKPYREAGLCAQRWYDISAGLIFLGHTTGNGGIGGPITTQGISGTPVLSVGDADGGDLDTGVRLSGSLVFGGAGASLEATWIGGHDWRGAAEVTDPNAGLFSFISDFGNLPLDGFDDTDRSIVQRVENESELDTIELNYRRRTVWPFCRFQSSWLIGFRYIRFDDSLLYSTLGENNNTVNASLPRFFSSNDSIENQMFGGQVGGDFWWNISPGVSLGVGGKIGVLKNDIDRVTTLTANSLDPIATPGTVSLTDGRGDTNFFGEFEFKYIHRLSHAWTFRTSYYLLGVDEVDFGTIDEGVISQFVQGQNLTDAAFGSQSLIVQGFSFGMEYLW